MRAILAVWAYSDAYPLRLVVLFIGGLAISVVSGMIYKIVPFLAWFHLQAQLQARAGSIPTMKDMIQTRRMRGQFRLHLAACVLLATAVLWGRRWPLRGAACWRCWRCCCGSICFPPRDVISVRVDVSLDSRVCLRVHNPHQ